MECNLPEIDVSVFKIEESQEINADESSDYLSEDTKLQELDKALVGRK